MNNPFDHVINVDNKQEEVKNIQTTVSENKGGDHMHVSFSINKKMLERGAYITIIIILAGLLYFNPFCNSCAAGEDNALTGAAVAQIELDGTADINESQEEKTEEKPAEVEKVEVKKEEPEKVEKPFSGNFKLELKDVIFIRNDDGNPSSMKELIITLTNNWKDFTPRVKVFWYDDDANEIIKEQVKLDKVLGVIKDGKKYTFTLYQDEFNRFYGGTGRFFPGEPEETIKVMIYEGDEPLATAKKTIS